MPIENYVLIKEIMRLRSWEAGLPAHGSLKDWEQEYPGWDALNSAFAGFTNRAKPHQWDKSTIRDLLYILARDNEAEYLASLLETQPEGVFILAEAAVGEDEPDAKWQLAELLGRTEVERERAEEILLVLVHDSHEYVSRRVLLSLANLGSSHVPSLCVRAWETGHEYQRIAALHAIQVAAPHELPKFIELAKDDGRQHVVQNAMALEEKYYLKE